MLRSSVRSALSIAQGLGPSFAPALNSLRPPDETIVCATGRIECRSMIAATDLIPVFELDAWLDQKAAAIRRRPLKSASLFGLRLAAELH